MFIRIKAHSVSQGAYTLVGVWVTPTIGVIVGIWTWITFDRNKFGVRLLQNVAVTCMLKNVVNIYNERPVNLSNGFVIG